MALRVARRALPRRLNPYRLGFDDPIVHRAAGLMDGSGGKTSIYTVDVHFGDCDPAGIVFFPNFSRWMDAASHHFFRHCGLPAWHSMPELPNSVGAPMLEIHTRFVTSATYGERLDIHTRVEEWRNKVFVQHHRIVRGDDLVCEGRETRALCVRDATTGRIKAIPIPDFIRDRCS